MTNELRLVEAIRQALDEELARDDSVVVYGEDVGVNGGVFRATRELAETYPDRVYDTPVAEAGIVGMGVGLAAYGLKPVAEIQFASFAYQAFHQIQQHAARMRARTRGTLNCQLTIRMPYGGGIRALELHSESFEAGWAHVPGLKVAVPSNPADGKGLLAASIRDPDPVVFLEPTRLYRATRESVPEGDHVVPLGEAAVVAEGEDATAVAWGGMVPETLDAVDDLDASVEVVDLRTVSPMDTEAVLDSVRKTGRCVVVHEAPRTGGFAAEILARINDDALYHLEAPVERVTGYDVPFPLFAREDAYRPDADRIRRGIERALSA
ncbi:alpha-ketoacid dehydrogenase subunit beta (plasmid) [Halorussus salilacus]|uniref:alpha-ketoacid dehydrogenase subunit beta n=1 Tax=Halorussus salilacus TaxID=2953750 RepID=UPI0020A21FAB|nr:alpha-ketoacid dehydrogenase subunit beta [Halorussus salilacus]USZ69939.1 alpha-ketoacid dehydrogenase subunit beta [Halorussus salilacus]